jgi:hypothetical protein
MCVYIHTHTHKQQDAPNKGSSSSSSSSSSSMARWPEVELRPPLNDASKLACLEILFSSFSFSTGIPGTKFAILGSYVDVVFHSAFFTEASI